MRTPWDKAMGTIVIGFALSLAAVLALAQPAPQAAPQSSSKPTNTFTSASGVTALIAKAKSERKEGQPTVAEPILELGSYDGHLDTAGATRRCRTRGGTFLRDRWFSHFDDGRQARQREANRCRQPQWLRDRRRYAARIAKETGFWCRRTRRTASAPSTAFWFYFRCTFRRP